MKAILAFLVFGIILFSGCSGMLPIDCTLGSGNVVSEIREMPLFNSIEVRSSVEVHFTQGEHAPITVRAEDNLMEDINTYVSGKTLIIEDKPGTCLGNTKPVKVTVSMEEVEKLSILGSGEITSINTVTADEIEVSVIGSGNIDLKADAEEIKVSIPGDGEILLEGTTSALDISIIGSGAIEAFDLIADAVKVDIMGSGDVEVTAVEQLDVNIMGSGNVDYKGTPKVSQSGSGSGRIRSVD
ncbi:MAG: DUF2807 domain-containing protein [bacterium]|nr:DUF2807 domain-containing protein [bacterium]